ncbi:MAG: SpoIIE family protein phosphatase [Holosporaceae bacterium]|jgi:sigma-B regulation protein RsbU (phosphoserine phosphatase)|nr:SpoIIE family protein phosphatase [Holosporaceae bacterium]
MRAKILVLDDEYDTQDLFTQKFRHQIAEDIYTFSFATCLEQVQEQLHDNDFDIFLSDINVDGMDGISLINHLKMERPLMRSVVISAYGDINTLRAVMRGGAHDFVIKPIDFTDLSDTLEKTANVVAGLKQAEATKKKLSAISDELDVSAKLQRSILPGNVVQKGCIDLFADTTPAAEVGGDFYDYFWLNDTKLGVVMADVSGKNISAAMFATIAKTLIKSFSRVYESPAECFKNVNIMICQENVTTMFVTAMYGVIDTKRHEIIYTNAGHLPIAVMRPGMVPEFLECDSGMALGIFDEVEFVDHIHVFAPEETFVLYTDGVTEAANPKGEEYDFERFAKVLETYTSASPRTITGEIIKSIRKFADGAPQSDDITTLCVKYNKGAI